MSKSEQFSPRLTIYGTGFVGQVVARLAVSKGWEIVAAYNRAGNEEEAMVWRVKGQPGMEIRVVREDSDIATASSLLNRVPDILTAPPGVRTVTEYGHLRPCC